MRRESGKFMLCVLVTCPGVNISHYSLISSGKGYPLLEDLGKSVSQKRGRAKQKAILKLNSVPPLLMFASGVNSANFMREKFHLICKIFPLSK
jgi:hypothetical protein